MTPEAEQRVAPSAESPDAERQKRHPLPAAARLLGLTVAGLFIALLVYGVLSKAPNTTIDSHLSRAESVPAPGFDLAVLQPGVLGPELTPRIHPALTDGRVALKELRGKPVVLNFWASWCIPCREEAPRLERSWRDQARGRGVLFLGLDMQDLTDAAGRFMREFRISYLNIRDPSNRIARRYGVTGLPETFFISARGRVVGHVIGVASPQQLTDGIATALRGRPRSARKGGTQGSVR